MSKHDNHIIKPLTRFLKIHYFLPARNNISQNRHTYTGHEKDGNQAMAVIPVRGKVDYNTHIKKKNL